MKLTKSKLFMKPRLVKQQARFVARMEEGRISDALRCIGSQETSVLDVTPDVLTELKEKHPEGKKASSECLFKGPLLKKLVKEVVFENIDAITRFSRLPRK